MNYRYSESSSLTNIMFVSTGRLVPTKRRHTHGLCVRQAQHETQRNGRLVQSGPELLRAGGAGPLDRYARGHARRAAGPLAHSGGFLISVARAHAQQTATHRAGAAATCQPERCADTTAAAPSSIVWGRWSEEAQQHHHADGHF